MQATRTSTPKSTEAGRRTPSAGETLGRSPTPSDRPRLGAIFGRHLVVERLGRGGEGTAFLARHESLEIPVVIKADNGGSRQGVESLRHEATLLARFKHPNIIRILDAVGTGDWPYLVLEYADAPGLDVRIAEGSLTVAESLWIAAQVAHALVAVAEAGLVHRDVKPSNVLLCSDGTARLSDFGAATDGRDPIRRDAIVGSPAYMAPEQITDTSRVDARADIYALGVTLYEALTGRRPFKGDSGWDLMMLHVNDMPTDPREHNPAVPAAVAEIVMRCLEKNPDDRFQSAAELRDVLMACLQSQAA